MTAQKPPAFVARLLFRLFYQVEIRASPEYFKQQHRPLAGADAGDATMPLWQFYRCRF